MHQISARLSVRARPGVPILGAFWFRLISRFKFACRGRLAGLFKSKSKNINAEDTDVDALLAQAEYIFNNADEFVTADVEEALFA